MSEEKIKSLDHRHKWALLAVSLATLVLLAASALSENVFAPWRMVRAKYAATLESKADDEQGRLLAAGFKNEIVQNVVPELNVVDRCVTCHPGLDDPRMADEPQPYRTHPGDYLEHHPPERYGCTICHQGQGRATVLADAKASDVHWDYPLLPGEFAQSSCAMCHAPDQLGESAPLAARGYALFVENGCFGCHKVGGVGGAMGPVLDRVGVKKKAAYPFAHIEGERTIANWHVEHLLDPQKIVPDTTMKNFNFSREDAVAITNYILSLRGLEIPMSYIPKDRIAWEYNKTFRPTLTGKDLYGRYCSACHQDGMASHFDPVLGRHIPTVRNPAFLAFATDDFLRQTIERGRPGRDMPAWGETAGGLRADEIDNLVAYLREGAPLSPDYDETYRAAGDAGRGGLLFERNCSGCHGDHGEGLKAPSLANTVFQETASDAYLQATIKHGRHGTAMAGFGQDSPSFSALTDREVGDLVMFIRALKR